MGPIDGRQVQLPLQVSNYFFILVKIYQFGHSNTHLVNFLILFGLEHNGTIGRNLIPPFNTSLAFKTCMSLIWLISWRNDSISWNMAFCDLSSEERWATLRASVTTWDSTRANRLLTCLMSFSRRLPTLADGAVWFLKGFEINTWFPVLDLWSEEMK